MAVLAWLAVPLVVTALAFLVVRLRSHPNRTADSERGMSDLGRFREAMDRPMPSNVRVTNPSTIDLRVVEPAAERDGASAA